MIDRDSLVDMRDDLIEALQQADIVQVTQLVQSAWERQSEEWEPPTLEEANVIADFVISFMADRVD